MTDISTGQTEESLIKCFFTQTTGGRELELNRDHVDRVCH